MEEKIDVVQRSQNKIMPNPSSIDKMRNFLIILAVISVMNSVINRASWLEVSVGVVIVWLSPIFLKTRFGRFLIEKMAIRYEQVQRKRNLRKKRDGRKKWGWF